MTEQGQSINKLSNTEIKAPFMQGSEVKLDYGQMQSELSNEKTRCYDSNNLSHHQLQTGRSSGNSSDHEMKPSAYEFPQNQQHQQSNVFTGNRRSLLDFAPTDKKQQPALGSLASLDTGILGMQKYSAFNNRRSLAPPQMEALSPQSNNQTMMRAAANRQMQLSQQLEQNEVTLPRIKGHNESPLNGFIDISMTKQKLQKAVKRHEEMLSPSKLTLNDRIGNQTSMQPVTTARQNANSMILESVRKNKDLMTLLSPRADNRQSTMLSPTQSKEAVRLRNARYPGSPPAERSASLMADQKAEKKRMDLTFGEAKLNQLEAEGQLKKDKTDKKEVQAGKALLSGVSGKDKPLKHTRFSLQDKGQELGNEIMEQWFDKCLEKDKDVMKEASLQKFSKADMRTATKKYGISKFQLKEMGMQEEYINRIQRGLFVHSMGFYELVREASKPCKNSALVTINIWTIFSKLLETCCKTDHKLLMMELTDGLRKEIDKVKEDCASQISGFGEKEAVLVKRINECEQTISELDFKLANSQKDLMVSNDHIKTLNKQAEANSQVRMQIEKRLNELHNRKRRDDYAIAELQSQLSVTKKHNLEHVQRLKTEGALLADYKLRAETAEQQIKVDSKSMESTRRELGNKLKALRSSNLENDQMKKRMQDLTVMYEKQVADHNETQQKLDMHIQITTSLTTDRDRYKKVYDQENAQRLKLEEKGETNTVLLYETQKELADRRIRMGFTDKIIAGKDLKIEKLKEKIADWQYRYEDLECHFDNVNNEKDARVDECARRVEAHEDVVKKIHILDAERDSLEKSKENATKMNRDLREKLTEVETRLLNTVEGELAQAYTQITKCHEQYEELELKLGQNKKINDGMMKTCSNQIGELKEQIQSERYETGKWKDRYKNEQRQHKETQKQILTEQSEALDKQKRESEIEYQIKNLEQMRKIQDENLHVWQKKYNESAERIKELERQVNASRKMRDMLENVKEEKIALIRQNMNDLKGTYEKFLHENAMCAEDVRSTARHTFQKWEYQNEVIQHLEETIEKMRLDTIKKDTIQRRKQENDDSCIHDYEAQLCQTKKQLKKAQVIAQNAVDEKEEQKHENKRIMIQTTPAAGGNFTTTKVGITQTNEVQKKNNFTQMLNNQPIPKFANRGFQTEIKEFKQTGSTCHLIETPVIEVDADVVSQNVKIQSKNKFRQDKLVYCKSEADMQAIQENKEEMEYDAHGQPILKTREMDIQVGASLLGEYHHVFDRTREQSDAVVESHYTTLNKLAEAPDECLSPAQLSQKRSLLQNTNIMQAMQKGQEVEVDSPYARSITQNFQPDSPQAQEKEQSILNQTGKGTQSFRNNLTAINLGDQAAFKHGQFQNQPQVQSMSLLFHQQQLERQRNSPTMNLLRKPNPSSIRRLVRLAHQQNK